MMIEVALLRSTEQWPPLLRLFEERRRLMPPAGNDVGASEGLSPGFISSEQGAANAHGTACQEGRIEGAGGRLFRAMRNVPVSALIFFPPIQSTIKFLGIAVAPC